MAFGLTDRVRVVSYGGGVQSTALVVLAATGRLDDVMGGPIEAGLFANVGDDSEHPETLAYVRTQAVPWAEARGFPIHEISRRPTRGRFAGRTETLFGRLTEPGSRSVGIPIRMSGSGAPGTRACTADFKIRTVARWLKDRGVTEADPALVAVGISTDEAHRANNRKLPDPIETIVYPLLDLGLSRADCAAIASDAGLPVPPKSACWFCPLHSLTAWAEMRRDRPDLFSAAVDLEIFLNDRRAQLGKDPVWFSSRLAPLGEIPPAQPGLFKTDWVDGDACESGHCWT